MKIYDISRDLISSPLYPGTVPPLLKVLASIEGGSDYRLSELTAEMHTGTHVDAPSHCLTSGDTVDRLDLRLFVGYALVYDLYLHNIPALTPASEARILLLKNSSVKPLSEDDCNLLRGLGYITVGVDALTVGSDVTEYAVHKSLLLSGMGVIENLCLDGVEEGQYFLSALPVKISGAEASFCRAVLIDVT